MEITNKVKAQLRKLAKEEGRDIIEILEGIQYNGNLVFQFRSSLASNGTKLGPPLLLSVKANKVFFIENLHERLSLFSTFIRIKGSSKRI